MNLTELIITKTKVIQNHGNKIETNNMKENPLPAKEKTYPIPKKYLNLSKLSSMINVGIWAMANIINSGGLFVPLTKKKTYQANILIESMIN